jgi:hypothetical protein
LHDAFFGSAASGGSACVFVEATVAGWEKDIEWTIEEAKQTV